MQLLENKIIRIVEERGYMGTKYIPVIKEIVSYCQDYIKNNEFTKENIWIFNLPYELTKKIDCVENLIIEITIEDNFDGVFHTGGGTNDVFYHNNIVDGKLEYGKITLYGYSYHKNLFIKTIFNNLSHELNHLQEIHTRMLKRDNAQTIFKLNKDALNAYNGNFSKDKILNNYIYQIIYRLMRKSEFNALINGVYGDLDDMNSNRHDFNKDIKNTQAYYIYTYIRNNISMLDELSDDDWNEIRKSFNILSAFGAKHRVDINSFKIKFKEMVIQRLNELIKGIGKIASFYYDKKESFENEQDVITI